MSYDEHEEKHQKMVNEIRAKARKPLEEILGTEEKENRYFLSFRSEKELMKRITTYKWVINQINYHIISVGDGVYLEKLIKVLPKIKHEDLFERTEKLIFNTLYAWIGDDE